MFHIFSMLNFFFNLNTIIVTDFLKSTSTSLWTNYEGLVYSFMNRDERVKKIK
jgi:hypothetical protein